MATATAVCIIPPVNSLRFTDPDKVMPAKFNLRHFDEYPAKDSILPFQQDPEYATKIQSTMETWIQFHYNLFGYDISILDSDGKEIYSTLATSPVFTSSIFRVEADFAGNVWDNNGTITPIALHTGTAKINWGALTLTDNRIYYVKIRMYQNTLKTAWIDRVSEPILYATKHYNTVRIDAAHATNDFGIFWAFQHPTSLFIKWNIVFQYLVDGYLENFEINGTDVFYENQMSDLRQLSSRPYRNQMLYIGDGYGVMDYTIDRLGRAMSCSYTLIDGKRYVKEENAKMEIQRKDHEALKLASIQVREYYGADAGVLNSTYTSEEAPSGGFDPIGSPFTPVLGFPTGTGVTIGGTVLLTSDAEAIDYAQYLTKMIKGIDPDDLLSVATYPYGLYGDMMYSSLDGLYYSPSASDSFSPTFTYSEKAKFFTIGISSFTDGLFVFKFLAPSITVDWGDGSDLEVVNYAMSGGEYQTASHTYSASGSYSVKVYHNDTDITGLKFGVSDFLVDGFLNDMPSGLEYFEANAADLPTFDFELLEPAAGNIKSIAVINSNTDTLVHTTFDTNLWTAGLKYIDFTGNGLSDSDVELFIQHFVAKCTIEANGLLKMEQTPPAIPTTVDAELELLQGYKWEIIVDLP